MIFDEAHNIEQTCESAASFELAGEEIAGMIDEVDQVRPADMKFTGRHSHELHISFIAAVDAHSSR